MLNNFQEFTSKHVDMSGNSKRKKKKNGHYYRHQYREINKLTDALWEEHQKTSS